MSPIEHLNNWLQPTPTIDEHGSKDALEDVAGDLWRVPRPRQGVVDDAREGERFAFGSGGGGEGIVEGGVVAEDRAVKGEGADGEEGEGSVGDEERAEEGEFALVRVGEEFPEAVGGPEVEDG